LDVKMDVAGGGGGGNKKVQPSADAQAQALRPAIDRAVRYALRNSRLSLIEASESAVLHVTVTPTKDGAYNVLQAEASLKCRDDGSDPVQVWHIEKGEVMRFLPSTNNRVLMDLWEDKVRDFFKPLRTDHEEAVRSAGG
jgi:hypothetical protein